MTGPDPAAELAAVEADIADVQRYLRRHGPRHRDYGWKRYYLATCRFTRYSLIREQADLDACITDLEGALAALAPAAPLYARTLATLAGVLTERFRRTGQVADLEGAVSVGHVAVDVVWEGHPAQSMSLSALGTALWGRYEHKGVLDDLNAAISLFQAAVDAAGKAGADPCGCLSDLGIVLRLRSERTSDPADLDAAIQAGQAALAASPPDDVDARVLSSLGLAFIRRFQLAGVLADVDAASKALRAAVAVLPPGDPDRAALHANLAVVLVARFLRTQEPDDLSEALDASELAIDAADDSDPQWATIASASALVLFTRYQQTTFTVYLNAAISRAAASVAATSPDHPGYATGLMNLAGYLHARFQATGDPADLDEVINGCNQALAARGADHVERGDVLVDLGIALRTRFRRTKSPSDRDAARAAFAEVAGVVSTPASVRARAAVAAAQLAEGQPAMAARLLESAVRLLAEAVPRRLVRGDQQHAIIGLTGLADIVASAALADPSAPAQRRPAKALELLEAGRAVLLSQALETRDELTDLRHEHGDLAARFVRLRDQLDRPDRDTGLPGPSLAVLSRDVGERERLALELAQTLAEIRTLDEFAGFGLPPSVDELRAEAAHGPVVTLICGAQDSGGALLLTTDGISYLDLAGLTDDAATDQVNGFLDAVRELEGDDEALAAGAERTIAATLQWLWETITGPVLGALGYLRRPAEGQAWPRVWWVPGGKLGLLPVHAAGYHGEHPGAGEPARSVMDAVVSSYTPTVRALRYARQQARHRKDRDRALIIAMPTTAGQQELPGAAAEAAAVRAALPGAIMLARPDDDALQVPSDSIPTSENVLRYLPGCTIAHFASHAWSDSADPSRSLLLLEDYQTAPLTVAALAPVDHDGLELTYLSACSTAFTAPSLADEAIHLTSAFLLAGSRHVIGTLWSASDLVSVAIATDFYARLRDRDGAIDTDQAARALHSAVRVARDRWPGKPSLWAPYLHVGA